MRKRTAQQRRFTVARLVSARNDLLLRRGELLRAYADRPVEDDGQALRAEVKAVDDLCWEIAYSIRKLRY